jgi:hypothetical protein
LLSAHDNGIEKRRASLWPDPAAMGNLNTTHVDPSRDLKEVDVAVRSRFTRIPKVHVLILAGVPTEAIPTYCALADYSNNKTGLCWPRMETLAKRLSRSPRTIQCHLHLLKEKRLVEFVERKRDWHGRFGAYLYRVVHIAVATSRKAAKEIADRKGRRRKNTPPPDTQVRWPPIRGKLNNTTHSYNPHMQG